MGATSGLFGMFKRGRLWRILLVTAVIGNLSMTLLYYRAFIHERHHDLDQTVSRDKKTSNAKVHNDNIPSSKSATIIICEFEDFENDVVQTVKSALLHNSNISVAVLADSLPYPPLHLPSSSDVNLVVLQTSLNQSFKDSRPESYIHASYTVILPDAVEMFVDDTVQYMVDFLNKQAPDVRLAAWPVDPHTSLQCLGLQVLMREWTLRYTSSDSPCSAIEGRRFALILRTQDLYKLSAPFARPVHKSIFIQSAAKGWKVALGNKALFKQSKPLFENLHNQWKHKTKEHSRIKSLYAAFGIKLVQHADSQKEWFGCNKDTQRCFGTIANDMPDYLYKGRWTPPCCLNALRTATRHVVRILESQNVRYWLEGGSLLGAARNGDIIPWDYDVDIGIYKEDIANSEHLQAAQSEPFIDEDGFVWQKSVMGDFINVHYSQSNRLHVDIFYFSPKNGTMTKDTWIKTHRQDKEFPESYLKPLVKIPFAGMQASAPNNWRQFLEFKFGTGVIENPRYPDKSKLQ